MQSGVFDDEEGIMRSTTNKTRYRMASDRHLQLNVPLCVHVNFGLISLFCYL